MPPAKTTRIARAVDPVPASSSNGTASSRRQVNPAAAASSISSSTSRNGKSSKGARLASAALSLGDSDEDRIDSDVPEPAKKMGLTNRATNILENNKGIYALSSTLPQYEIGEDKWLLDPSLQLRMLPEFRAELDPRSSPGFKFGWVRSGRIDPKLSPAPLGATPLLRGKLWRSAE
ncbi:hypothetical protein V8E36_001441 [Tilletia maclaganii]